MFETKEVASSLYFIKKCNLTLSEIQPCALEFIPKLYSEIRELGLEIIGPMQFMYFGIDGKPETRFDLMMSLPIDKKGAEPKLFQYYQTKPFFCAHTDYQGPMHRIGEAWGKFVKEIVDSGMRPTGEIREVYKVWVGDESEDNISELQMGIS